jgi:hypothetical protein
MCEGGVRSGIWSELLLLLSLLEVRGWLLPGVAGVLAVGVLEEAMLLVAWHRLRASRVGCEGKQGLAREGWEAWGRGDEGRRVRVCSVLSGPPSSRVWSAGLSPLAWHGMAGNVDGFRTDASPE